MVLERFNSNSRGFSLVEVIIAMGLLTVVSLGVAQVFATTGRANLVARGTTSTTAMAEQKMEQLLQLMSETLQRDFGLRRLGVVDVVDDYAVKEGE